MTLRPGMGCGGAVCRTGGAMGLACGCAATAWPLALIMTGRAFTGTGLVTGRVIMLARVGCTSGRSTTRNCCICCGVT
jgi:hypothetical protein